MASRKQASSQLAELAQIVATNTQLVQQTAGLLGRFNAAITTLESQVQELNEATDDFERRLTDLERRVYWRG